MEVSELTKVRKVRGTTNETEVNKLLSLGWVLLVTSAGKDESDYPITRFTLGWAKDGEPVEPKPY